jgi:hypothetical protein
MSKRNKYLLGGISVLLILWMLADSFLQPGVKDLKGDFKELAFIRNEQNTGPIIRIYAVSVKDTLWNDMKQYGNYMPHTKYGTTKVYYFLNMPSLPEGLTLTNENIADKYKSLCVARYEKDVMSQENFQSYPFRNR